MGTTKDPLRYHRVPAHLSASALGLLNTEKSKKLENVSCKELFRYEKLFLILDFLQRFAELLFCNLEIDCRRDQEMTKWTASVENASWPIFFIVRSFPKLSKLLIKLKNRMPLS